MNVLKHIFRNDNGYWLKLFNDDRDVSIKIETPKTLIEKLMLDHAVMACRGDHRSDKEKRKDKEGG